MIEKQFYAILGFLLLWLSSPAVRADTLDFTLTGEGTTYTFQLPSSPNPSGSGASYFDIVNVIVTRDHESEVAADVLFYTNSAYGGLEFYRDLPQLYGPQVFSVDQGNPTFITGGYGLENSEDGSTYVLTIAAPPGGGALPVPEPSTWAMMLLGFAGLGYAGYRETKRARFQPA
jgi:PEP-CTERM motif